MSLLNVNYRWMMFVDGENLTVRTQEKAARLKVDLTKFAWRRDVFFWGASKGSQRYVLTGRTEYGRHPPAVRCYYYTYVQGDELDVAAVHDEIQQHDFAARVFKKPKGQRAKGVDICLTKDMLSHAYQV